MKPAGKLALQILPYVCLRPSLGFECGEYMLSIHIFAYLCGIFYAIH